MPSILTATNPVYSIAAPLNPGYKQKEFEFYIDDLKSALALVPKGAYAQNSDAVRAAKIYNAAIAECYWDGKDVVLDIKDKGKHAAKGGIPVQVAQPDDVALVLHTSGTTGRPKAVPLTHKNLTRTMSKALTFIGEKCFRTNPVQRTSKERTSLL